MDLPTLLVVTGLGHAILASAVFVSARRADRAVTRWTLLTLLTGVFGAGAYYLLGSNDG